MAGELKLGLNTGYWAGGPPPGVTESVAEAERLGFDSIWTAEAYGSDCLTPLAWWGASTERIKLGTAIVQMSARQPAATATRAVTGQMLIPVEAGENRVTIMFTRTWDRTLGAIISFVTALSLAIFVALRRKRPMANPA